MFGITDLTTFIIGTIFIVLLPGPNSLYVMTAASRFGMKAGFRAAGGVFSGDLVLIILSSVGVASALKTMPTLYLVLKYAGAVYLAYLGAKMIWASWHSWKTRHLPTDEMAMTEVKNKGHYRTALIVSLLNPKAIVFYISFFIQFVDPDYAQPGLSFLILGVIVQFFSVLYLVGLIFGGIWLAAYFRRHKTLTAVSNTTVGGIFMAFGASLATGK